MKEANKKDYLQQVAQSFGQRLAIMIASLNVSDEIKGDILNLLPSMSEQQLLDFSDILEQAYLEDKTQSDDNNLIIQLKKILSDYQKEEDYLLEETNNQLAGLLKSLKV